MTTTAPQTGFWWRNDRVIFVGIAPSDKLENEDAPQTILQFESPNDTDDPEKGPSLPPQRQGGEDIRPGLPTQVFASSRGDQPALDSLVAHVNRRLDAQRVEAIRETRIRAAVAALIDEPIYYVVKRGDAISTIASRFDTTPEMLKKWNNLESNRVRIGERLIVKAKGPRPYHHRLRRQRNRSSSSRGDPGSPSDYTWRR